MAISFSKVINDLRRKGWSNGAIARHCGVSAVYIGQLRRRKRKEPGYTLGANLVELRDQECQGGDIEFDPEIADCL